MCTGREGALDQKASGQLSTRRWSTLPPSRYTTHSQLIVSLSDTRWPRETLGSTFITRCPCRTVLHSHSLQTHQRRRTAPLDQPALILTWVVPLMLYSRWKEYSIRTEYYQTAPPTMPGCISKHQDHLYLTCDRCSHGKQAKVTEWWFNALSATETIFTATAKERERGGGKKKEFFLFIIVIRTVYTRINKRLKKTM